MPRHIVVIQGHPDSSEHHLCHALADAYAEGARHAGHEVQLVVIAELDFPLLRSAKARNSPEALADIQNAQDTAVSRQFWRVTGPLQVAVT